MTDQPPPTGAPINSVPPTGDPLPPPAPPAARSRRPRVIAIVVGVVVALVVATGVTQLLHFLNNDLPSAKPTKFTSSSFNYSVTLPGHFTVSKPTTGSGEPAQRVQWTGSDGQTVTVEAEALPNAVAADRYDAVFTAGLAGGVKALNGTDIRERKSFTLGGERAASEVATTSLGGATYIAVSLHDKTIISVVITHTTAALERSVDTSFGYTN